MFACRLAIGLAVLAAVATASVVDQQQPRVINNLLIERLDALPGVQLEVVDDRAYTTVERTAPRLLDDALLHDEDWQRIFGPASDFAKPFPPHYAAPYVASIPDATVFSTMGEVIDKRGNVYASLFATPSVEVSLGTLAKRASAAATKNVHRFTKLATTVHVFGHMYFHFMTESLPRILMLKPILAADPEVKVLTWNLGAWDKAWMQQLLGVDESRIVEYNPEEAYSADVVYLPSPLVRTGFQYAEDLERLRNAVGADLEVPAAKRNNLIYISRKDAEDRRIRNEEQLVNKLRLNFPDLNVVVYDSDHYSIMQTVELFKRAKVVLSGHGAGMSHTVFCAKGTPIIEIHHADIADEPHVDFYMTSTALKQVYYMVPVTGVTWLATEYDTFIPLTVSTVQRALYDVYGAGNAVCATGFGSQPDGSCDTCPAGTYSTGMATYIEQEGTLASAVCLPCDAGWVSVPGKGGCHPCPHGSFASPELDACVPCPEGQSTAFLGSTGPQACKAAEAARTELKTANNLIGGIFKTSAIVRRYMREAQIPVLTVDLPKSIVDKVVDHWEHVSNRRLALADAAGCNSYGACTPPPAAPTSVTVKGMFGQGASGDNLVNRTGRAVVWNDDSDFLDIRLEYPTAPTAVLGPPRCKKVACGPCNRAWRPAISPAGATRTLTVFFKEPLQVSAIRIAEVNAPGIVKVETLRWPAAPIAGAGPVANRTSGTVVLNQTVDLTPCGSWLNVTIPPMVSGIRKVLPPANTASARNLMRTAVGGIRVTVVLTGVKNTTTFISSIKVDGRVLYPADPAAYSKFIPKNM